MRLLVPKYIHKADSFKLFKVKENKVWYSKKRRRKNIFIDLYTYNLLVFID